MFTILISPFLSTIPTADHQKVRIYPLVIQKKRTAILLNTHENLGDVRRIKFFRYQKKPALQKIPLDIPPRIRKGIVRFLMSYHAKQDMSFDCYAFANLMGGIKQHEKLLGRTYWRTSPCPKRLKKGDIVFLLNREGNFFHHAAVYLGFGLYLSVYGAGGGLEVSRLRNMMKDFGAESVFLAKPRT
ncbi:MAG: hypothetical protein KIH65_001745 [Candidatus Uhrbacteria bacterium]|nr:hypothetical protein [Candidatus Uhrbacteria bacterium]